MILNYLIHEYYISLFNCRRSLVGAGWCWKSWAAVGPFVGGFRMKLPFGTRTSAACGRSALRKSQAMSLISADLMKHPLHPPPAVELHYARYGLIRFTIRPATHPLDLPRIIYLSMLRCSHLPDVGAYKA